MEVTTMEQSNSIRKRRLQLIGGLFIGILLTFTLLGNTLLALTLPKVITAEASKGELSYTYKGSSVLKPVQEVDLISTAGWKVTKVYVHEGDKVKKGQTLITYDSTEAQQQIEDERAALKKLELSMSLLENDYIEAAQNEDHTALLNAQTAIEVAKIDIDIQKEHIQTSQKKLLSNQELVAPFDGIIKDVKATEGQVGTTAGADIRIANNSKGFQFEMKMAATLASELTVGETMEVQLLGKKSRFIQGEISKIEDIDADGSHSEQGVTGTDATAARVIVTVQDKTATGGERLQVNIIKKGSENTLLISNSAVHKDSTGTYVFTVDIRQGALGSAYYAVRRPITILNEDEFVSAVSEGLFDKEQVITESSVPINDGERVRL